MKNGEQITNPLLTAALEHARAGRKVFPLHHVLANGSCSCGDGGTCRSAGKHPRFHKDDLPAGLKNATTDEAQIRIWWDRWPKANIGLATGRPSGFWVLDVDPRHGGDETLMELERRHGPLPHTVEAISASGGRHILFSLPEGFEVRNIQRTGESESPLGAGLDLRGDGGLIVGAGSRAANGRGWYWDAEHHPADTEIAPAASWLLELVRQAMGAGDRRGPAPPVPEKIPHGRQHNTLVSLAGTMRRRGMTAEEIEASLWIVNERRCEKPGTREAIRKIAESVARYPPEEFRGDGCFGRFRRLAEGAFASGNLPEDVDDADRPPLPGEEGAPSTRPTIVVTGRHMRDVSQESLQALVVVNGDAPTLFCRGTALVRVVARSPMQAEVLNGPALRGVLDRAADYLLRDKHGELKPARPPADVVADLLSLPEAELPTLAGVRHAPSFAAGGRLVTESGYEAESGLYLSLEGLEGVLADMPEAVALGLLWELLTDFPFSDVGSRAHALAMILQPYCRDLIVGPTPLYLVDAPTRGSGKGLLVDLAAILATGDLAPVMPLSADQDEQEKRVTATLAAGQTFILLDDVTTLRSNVLNAVLTGELWRGRILGESRMVTVRNDALWAATGNNVVVSDEMARRIAPIRLDPGCERPEERTGWKHPLPDWCRENRVALVGACLSLVKAWVDAGMPAGARTLGRYECWAAVMGGILAHAGVPGFLTNRERLHEQSDRDTQEWTAFCVAWWAAFQGRPVTAGEVFPLLRERQLLLDLWANRQPLSAQQRLGHALDTRRDRVFGDFRILAAGRHGRTGNAAYSLAPKVDPKTPETPETPGSPHETGPEAAGVSAKTPVIPGVSEQNTGRAEAVSSTSAGVSGVSGVLHPPSDEEEGDAAPVATGGLFPPDELEGPGPRERWGGSS